MRLPIGISGPILPRFRDIAGFLPRTATPPLFYQNFGVFLLNYIAGVVAPKCEDPKLITPVITFEVTQHTVHQRHRKTDG